jgi:hypothetical protein
MAEDATVLERVEAFRQQVMADGHADVSVRTLLEWFGSKRRGSKVVDRVCAALSQSGLRPGAAVTQAKIDDVLRFYADAEAEILAATGAGAAEARPGAPLGDMLLDLLRLGGVPLDAVLGDANPPDPDLAPRVYAAAASLRSEVEQATEWLELGPEESPESWLVLGPPHGAMPWRRFEEMTAAVYDWSARGPLWYSSPMTITDTTASSACVGAVVFCRDGWWVPDWKDPEASANASYCFQSWDTWNRFAVEERHVDGVVRPVLVLAGDAEEVVLSHAAAGDPAWSALSLALAHAVLHRIIPVVMEQVGAEELTHPPIDEWNVERVVRAFETGLVTVSADESADDATGRVSLGSSLPEGWADAAQADSRFLQMRGAAEMLTERRMGGDAVDEVPNRVLTREAVAAICARIRLEKVVPVWVPPEVLEHFEPFHKWNKVCWYLPWALLANGMNGPVCLELQGLSIADRDSCFQLGVDVDQLTSVPETISREFAPDPVELPGPENPRWREWTLDHTDGSQVSLFEHQPDESVGFHLDIMAAILEVQWPVIERSRHSPIVVHLPEDPAWRPFERLKDVVAWGMQRDDT